MDIRRALIGWFFRIYLSKIRLSEFYELKFELCLEVLLSACV